MAARVWIRGIGTLALLVALTGCAGSPTRLYVLTPVPAGGGAPAAPAPGMMATQMPLVPS